MPNKVGTRGDAYLVDSKLSKKELVKLAEALANPILEKYSINHLEVLPPSGGRTSKFGYLIEIGFLPGVTDNVGSTVKEIATDMFHLKPARRGGNNFPLAVYTSKIFFIDKASNLEEVQKFSSTS